MVTYIYCNWKKKTLNNIFILSYLNTTTSGVLKKASVMTSQAKLGQNKSCFITWLQDSFCPVASLLMRGKSALGCVGPPPSHNPSVLSTSPLTDQSSCDGRGRAGISSAWKTQRSQTSPYQKPACPFVDITQRPGLRDSCGFNTYNPAFCLCLDHEVLNQLESGCAAD